MYLYRHENDNLPKHTRMDAYLHHIAGKKADHHQKQWLKEVSSLPLYFIPPSHINTIRREEDFSLREQTKKESPEKGFTDVGNRQTVARVAGRAAKSLCAEYPFTDLLYLSVMDSDTTTAGGRFTANNGTPIRTHALLRVTLSAAGVSISGYCTLEPYGVSAAEKKQLGINVSDFVLWAPEPVVFGPEGATIKGKKIGDIDVAKNDLMAYMTLLTAVTELSIFIQQQAETDDWPVVVKKEGEKGPDSQSANKPTKGNPKKPWLDPVGGRVIYLDKLPTDSKPCELSSGGSLSYGYQKRGHWRRLMSPRYANHPKYGERIYIKPCWVGPETVATQGNLYTVQLHTHPHQ